MHVSLYDCIKAILYIITIISMSISLITKREEVRNNILYLVIAIMGMFVYIF